MRKPNNILAVSVILIIIAVLVFLGVTNRSDTVKANNNKECEAALALDVENDYPASPDGVVRINNQIEKVLWGNQGDDFSDEKLKTLVEKQRLLFDNELLGINPFETQIDAYKGKMGYLEEKGARLIQTDTETPVFSDDARRCSVNIKQFWSQDTQVIIIYNLKKEESTNKWKIVGWKEVTPEAEPTEVIE